MYLTPHNKIYFCQWIMNVETYHKIILSYMPFSFKSFSQGVSDLCTKCMSGMYTCGQIHPVVPAGAVDL